MRNVFITLQFILFSFIGAECYELNQSDCLDYPQYCEWNDEI